MNEEILDKQLYVDGFKLRNWSVQIIEVVVALSLVMIFTSLINVTIEESNEATFIPQDKLEFLLTGLIIELSLICYALKWRAYSFKMDHAVHRHASNVFYDFPNPMPLIFFGIIHLLIGLARLYPGPLPPSSPPTPPHYELHFKCLLTLGVIHFVHYALTAYRTNLLSEYLKKIENDTAKEDATE